MKTFTITAPDGQVINESKLKEGKIEFLPEKPELPSKWELEYDKKYYYIDDLSGIQSSNDDIYLTSFSNYNMLPSQELARAMLALCKLLVMRDRYNDNWIPKNDAIKYIIYNYNNTINTFICTTPANTILTFKTKELRDLFLKNFKEDIEIALPLL